MAGEVLGKMLNDRAEKVTSALALPTTFVTSTCRGPPQPVSGGQDVNQCDCTG
jgi:hypothetical protein